VLDLVELPTSVIVAVLGFILAASIVIILTPLMARVAGWVGIVDKPSDERRMHVAVTPLLGGLAIYVGVIVPMVALIQRPDAATYAILVGGTIIAVVGLVDDSFEIRPLLKFAGQLVAIGVVLAFGVQIGRVSLPMTNVVFQLPEVIAVPLTVLWIATIVNMVNFIDGLDGLAAGVGGISALTFSVIALSLDRGPMGITAAVLAGAAFGFLRFNFHPASIFMGDAGSMFLGFVLAVISVQGVLKGAASVALIFPLLVLGLPFIDLFVAVVRRWRKGMRFYEASRDHLHHSLVLEAGFSQRTTVLLLYGWCVLLNAFALAMRFRWPVAMIVLGIAAGLATVSMVRLLVRYRSDLTPDDELEARLKSLERLGGRRARSRARRAAK
jgi:UDP-GlcNAc:undecaprenyl-phosphate/decaprenyl-phosphate GlcNAc-1-phosphate transferase